MENGMSGYLRVATKEDMELLFVWANEEAVRRNSFSQKEIGYEEHQQWYQKLLNNKNSKQYIYVQDEVDIGQARVDIIGDEAEVGYSICKEKRGNGYGSELLQLLIEQVRQDFPQVKKIVGKV